MKFLNLIIVSFLVLTSFTAQAGIIISPKANEKAIIVSFESEIEASLKVTIRDEKGGLIFKDLIQAEKVYGKKYNLKNLKNGVYDVVIEDSQKRTIESIDITSDKIELLAKRTSFKPAMEFKDNTLDFNLLAFGKNTSIKIFDDNSDLVFEETIVNQPTICKKYNLSNLKDGLYNIRVDHDGYSYYRSARVQK